MIRTIIIEDEVNVREALKKILQIIAPSIKILAETAYVSEAVDLIEKYKPDLVFMDIKLEDGTGFDVLNKLSKLDFNVIFTTAYNQYALKAFKYSTVDYLLKPIDPLELEAAIKRVKVAIKSKQEYEELLHVLQNNHNKTTEKIVLKTTEQRYIISISDIIRLEANGAYTNFITTDKKIIISKNLKYYQDILDANFIRCHQSHLINKKHVKGIKDKSIIMSNNEKIPISTRKRTEIINLISAND